MNKRYENFDAQIKFLASIQNECMKERSHSTDFERRDFCLNREFKLQEIIDTLRLIKEAHDTLNKFYQLWS